MSLRIANNVGSLTAQHNLSRSNSAMGRSLERLSSGFKVNRGADGPAALVISEKQRAQIAGLEAAIENTEKAVGVVQTAEGALSEINSLLVKVRSLAVDSANTGVNDADALAANQAEIKNALETIDRIANNTQFSTKKLLNGDSGITGTASASAVTFLAATGDTVEGTYDINVTTQAERATVASSTVQGANVLAADETLTINGIAITFGAGSTQDQVVERINSFTSETGVIADKNGTGGATRFYSSNFGSTESITVTSDTAAAVTSIGVGTTALTDSGVDIVASLTPQGGAATSYTGVGNSLTVATGDAAGLSLQFAELGTNATLSVTGAQGNVQVQDNSLVFQIGANKNQTAEIAIGKVTANSLGLGVTGNQFTNLGAINVESSDGAQDSLEVIDEAIDQITNMRGTLGAFQQNTLESTASNLRTTLENSVNVESIIRDTDFASEIAEFTKQQVLVQAGTSILGNANQTSQLVLSLL